MPNIGDLAPDFILNNSQGVAVRLSELMSDKPVVLYFYPKDDTPGCTMEACSFRDQYEDFLEAGAVVIGVSRDDEASHARFQQKHKLPYTLLSDPKGEVAKMYEVGNWLIPGRETFVIDKSGIIRSRFSSHLFIQKHISEAIEVLSRLKSEESSISR